MNVEGHVDSGRLKPAVVLTGTAKEGRAGPPIGTVDIGVNEKAYLCRIALPGLRNNESNLSCDIQRDGSVCISGVVKEGGRLIKDSLAEYEMKLQELCLPGPFTISFNLPGPVDPRLSMPKFRPDGILEITVLKSRSTV
ncbi:hypothetical protein NMG60_11033722 [Bertholletia excelsa]